MSRAAILLACCMGLAGMNASAQNADAGTWAATKASQLPLNNLPGEFQAPQVLPPASLAWEDSLYITRDGLTLYCQFIPADILKALIDGATPCRFVNYERGPLIGQDFTVPPAVCSPPPTAWLHTDVAFSQRATTSDAFGPWTLSNLNGRYFNLGSMGGILSSSDPSRFDIFAYTDDSSGSTTIKLLRNVPRALAPNDAGVALPANVDEPAYHQDNPDIERPDPAHPNSLVLFYDSDNKPGACARCTLPNSNRYFWFSTSADNGTTWTNPQSVTTINVDAGYYAQPHLYNDGSQWWLYYADSNGVNRARQGVANNWDSWGSPERVVSTGTSLGVGRPSLTATGDLSFVVVTHNPNGTPTDQWDIDPWLMKIDAGPADAGVPDAGTPPDAGPAPGPRTGCGCTSGGATECLATLLLACGALLRRSRRRPTQRLILVAALGGLIVSACSRPRPEAPDAGGPSEVEAYAQRLTAEMKSLRDRVVALRGIPLEGPFNFITYPTQAAFIDALKGATSGPFLESESRRQRFMAFYDAPHRRLVIGPNALEGGEIFRMTVLHEMTHAAQDKLVGVNAFYNQPGEAGVAAQSLAEGDAQLVATLDTFDQMGAPIDRMLAFAEAQPLPDGGTVADRVDDFPLAMGTPFAATLYRAGGFDAINRAYQHPPLTTAEILDPRRYVAGQLPRAIQLSHNPADQTGSWGARAVWGILSNSLPPASALALVNAMVGEAWVRRPADRAVLDSCVWRSDWKDEASAEKAEKIFRAMEWGGTSAQRWAGAPQDVSPVGSVQRRGASVVIAAVVLRKADPKRVLASAFAAPSHEQSRPPPLGPLALKPVERVPYDEATVAKGRYVNSFWGVSFAIPQGAVVEQTGPSPLTGVGFKSPSGVPWEEAEVWFWPRALDAAAESGLADQLSRAFPDSRPGPNTAWPAWPGARVQSAGTATQWIVPACESNAFVQVVAHGAKPVAGGERDAWIGSFDFHGAGTAPACHWLLQGR